MSPRTLACMFGAATALSTQIAVALGLGEVKLNSTLNQPLQAEIRLLQVRDLSEQEILVGLASTDDFRRVGVDRPFFLSDLQFDVDLSNPQQPIVRITSDKPVREPFLNFVIEAQWPSGRLLREYTLLMDLPVYAEDQRAQPVQPAARSSEVEQGRPAQQQRTSPPSRSQETTPPVQQPSPASDARASQGSTYGPVKSSDNLWNIAAAARPDRSVSVQQAMIAIQRANPGAFINDNINLLRQGQVLRIPSRDEMAQLTAREAVAEVAYQNQRWSGKDDATAQAPQLEGSRSYSQPESEPAQPEGRVKLTSPQDFADSNEGRGSGTSGGNTEALENELAATLEELDKTKGENTELKSRLEALEAQIQTMERLLDVSNEELRAMQLAAQQQQQAAEDAARAPEVPADDLSQESQTADAEAAPTAEDTAEGTVSAETDQPAADEVNEPEQPTAVVQTPDAAVQPDTEQPQRDPTRVVRSTPPTKASWLDLVMENLAFIGLGLVALLAALALFLRRRKKSSDDEEFDDFLTEPQAEQWEENEELETAPSADEYDTLVADEQDNVVVAGGESESANAPTEQETEDAVSEAGIYIALGQSDQAEEILLRALEKDPQDAEVRLKLLEVYQEQQDIESFDSHLAQLHALGDESAIARAEELRKRIPDAPEFDRSRFDTAEFAAFAGAGAIAGGAAAHASEPDEEDDFSFDLDLSSLEDEPDQGTQLEEGAAADLSDSETLDDFDFELDLGDTPSAPEAVAVDSSDASADANIDESDLDFEFELDTDDVTAAAPPADADEFEVDDEFAFDLGLEDLDEDADSAGAVTEGGTDESDVDDVSAADLDFAAALDETSEEEDRATDAPGDALPFELDGEEQSDDSVTAEDQHGIDFDLGGLDLSDEEDDMLAETPATDEAAEQDETASSFSPEGSEEDELNLDGDLDLSALDKELEAMTAALDEEDGLTLEDEGFDAEPAPGSTPEEQPAAGLEVETETESEAVVETVSGVEADEDDLVAEDETLAASVVDEDNNPKDEEDDFPLMDEPLTDFDDLDDLLALDDGQSESESKPEANAESEIPLADDVMFDWDESAEDISSAEGEPSDGGVEAQELESGLSMEDEPLEELDLEFTEAEESAAAEANESAAAEAEESVAAEAEEAPESEAEPLSSQAETEGDELPDYEALLASADDEFELEDIDPESDDDSDLGFLSDSDETATKLDLARAYIDMGDADGAKDILEEILQEGNDDQRKEAQQLLERV